MGLPRWRRLLWGGVLAALLAILFLVPVPLRVSGDARVLPDLRVPVTAEVAGRVERVLVREGDPVEAGQILALLSDTDYRLGEADARLRYEVALREQSRLRAAGETAGAAVEAPRISGLKAEIALWQERLEATRIRATASGIVATPRIEESVGAEMARGDLFCEVIDPDRQRIEVDLPEEEAGMVAAGMPVKVKLSAYPTTSLRATVERVGVAATVENGRRSFLLRALLDATPVPLRSGMSGQAKITTGPASIAHVALRRPARWIWGIAWGWLP